MSYTRTYREQIAVHYSGSVSYDYPASENGGSGTAYYSGTEYEDVNVNIEVDTDPFDNSVEHCNANVNLLTGAVVATETAQIASIDINSKKVANTIITGFFGYIRSEISQQIAELSLNIEAQMMHLRELAQSCLAKKKQMEGDFLRISGRYIKIFDDLNNELSSRIFELDKPAFLFKKELDNQSIRTTNNDLVNTVVVFGREGGVLHSKIITSVAKRRAFDTLNKAKVFLWQQKKLNNTIQLSMLNESLESSKFSPVCFVETKANNHQLSRGLYAPSFISALQENQTQNELMEQFTDASNSWSVISEEHADNLKLYFNLELNKNYLTSNPHSTRVKEMIKKISNLGSVHSLSV